MSDKLEKELEENKCPNCGHKINIHTHGFFLMGQKEIICDGCKSVIVVTASIGI